MLPAPFVCAWNRGGGPKAPFRGQISCYNLVLLYYYIVQEMLNIIYQPSCMYYSVL